MERRGPDEGGGREERRTSLTDSEVEDEVYSECLVSLSPGGGGGAALLPGALRHLQPRSPYTRDHRRRSAGKRQAPQPPSRPSPTTTPAPAPTPSPDTTPTPSLRPTPTSSPAPTPTPSPTPVTTVQMVLDSGVPSQSFTHLVSHPVLAPLGPATPTHLVSHPVLAPLGPATPTRSASSLTAARNLRIRLIDDDSDSESHLSDSFEEHIVFPRPGPAPGPPLVNQVVVTSTQVMTQTHLDLTSSSPPTRPPPAPTPLQVSSPGMPPPTPRAPGVVCRGRTRRLVHSSSDPGLPRHLRFQPPRSPSLAAAWPLDQVSEEEGEDGVGAGRGGLERSDSTVTVATLQEELLVAPRLKLRVTLTNITALVLVTALAAPHATILLYTSFRLVFGTLFPAYYSYKAVKTKNVKEYVKWMMYWIVFAFFTCFETLTDLFVSFWFPFYYELKILVVLWLLSPATRGSSILYRKFVHPWLARREEDIDQCIAQARQQGYSTVVQLGTKGVNYATTVLMQTAIKGGGGLMNQLRRSYSQSELVGEEGGDMNRNVKALPPHYPQDHYASDYSLDHHTHTSGTSQPQLHTHTTSHPQLDTPESLQLLPHAPESLQLLPHTPESLKLNRQHIATSLGHTSLQQGSQQFQLHSPDVLLHSLQPHLLPPMVTSYGQPGSLQRYEDDPYSSIRYTLSLGTPGSPPQSPVPPQHLTATPQYLTAIPHLTASPQYPTTTPQHLTAIPHLTASPQHPTATPQHLTTSHSLNPDARYSPPLTRHRAKQQQTVLD